MMEDQYVTFETAKLLWRNGFGERCRKYYLSDGNRYEHTHGEVLPKGEPIYPCPTQAMAMQWLRKEYNVHVNPIPWRYPSQWKDIVVYLGEPMEKDDKYDICQYQKVFASFEDAAEYGIQRVVRDIVAKIQKALLRNQQTDGRAIIKAIQEGEA